MPEKFAKLLLDEPSIAHEVLKMGNIYYVFNWLDKDRKHHIYFPDGELKFLYLPLNASSRTHFDEFLPTIRSEFKLLSGADSFAVESLDHTKIIYLDANMKALSTKPFPMIRIHIFLKHVKPLIQKLVEHGFIAIEGDKAIKEHRTIICDPHEDTGYWLHSGVPERGFEHYMLKF